MGALLEWYTATASECLARSNPHHFGQTSAPLQACGCGPKGCSCLSISSVIPLSVRLACVVRTCSHHCTTAGSLAMRPVRSATCVCCCVGRLAGQASCLFATVPWRFVVLLSGAPLASDCMFRRAQHAFVCAACLWAAKRTCLLAGCERLPCRALPDPLACRTLAAQDQWAEWRTWPSCGIVLRTSPCYVALRVTVDGTVATTVCVVRDPRAGWTESHRHVLATCSTRVAVESANRQFCSLGSPDVLDLPSGAFCPVEPPTPAGRDGCFGARVLIRKRQPQENGHVI